MKVYINGEKFTEFAKFVWKIKDAYLLRIIGVDLVSNDNIKLDIVPFYQPAFQVSAKAGQLVFQLMLSHERVLSFLFQARYPYIHIGKYDTEARYEE